MVAPFSFAVLATDGPARRGRFTTPHGTVETPVFMPCGTRAAIKGLPAADVARAGTQILLANTYHLLQRPGPDVVAALGGIHRFMAWDLPVLTDSGGFQVWSLGERRRLDADGVTFRSEIDGNEVRLTPESCVAAQERIGADVIMPLDHCLEYPATKDDAAASVRTTIDWARRSVAAKTREDQALFPIVQGGMHADLRLECAQALVELDMPGHALGGFSVGEPRDTAAPVLAAAAAALPADRPRYLMGVGDPQSLVDAVALGVDLFDCVLPSRLGRHGTVLTDDGRINLRNARFARDDEPIDASGPSPVSGRYSRGYVRHLLATDEPTGRRLLTLHNVGWLLRFVERMRLSIEEQRFAAFRRAVHETWGAKDA